MKGFYLNEEMQLNNLVDFFCEIVIQLFKEEHHM